MKNLEVDNFVYDIDFIAEKLRGRNLSVEEYEKLSEAVNQLFFQIKPYDPSMKEIHEKTGKIYNPVSEKLEPYIICFDIETSGGITPRPGSVKYNVIDAYENSEFYPKMDWEGWVQEVRAVPIAGKNLQVDIAVEEPKEKICECGKEKHGFARHLDFCGKYE